MNRCNNCGKLVPAGTLSCQNCGMPLTAAPGAGANPGMNTGQQPELPAWLESLRANERPGSPTGRAQSFSTTDLVDEGALPGWMRSDNAEPDNTSGQYPTWHPSSTPTPTTDDQPAFSRGFEARSLIDEQSLPSWMQGGQDNSQQTAQRNIPAQSLVQPDALPDWMKNLQQSSQPLPPAPPPSPYPTQAQGYNPPQAAPAPFFDNPPAAPPDMGQSSRLAASSLLDMNALPSWMREGEQSLSAASQGFQPSGPAPASNTPGGYDRGMAASSLIDTNALPEWLRNAENQPGVMPGQTSGRLGPTGAGRMENMRVPSRPRGEVSPQEQSEAAANVFSSMLGVAASAPSYPLQPQDNPFAPQQGMPQPGLPGQPNMPASMASLNTGMQPGLTGTGNFPPFAGPTQTGYTGAYPAGNQPPGMQAINTPGTSSNVGVQSYDKSPRTTKARKGFFDAIRDFFFNK